MKMGTNAIKLLDEDNFDFLSGLWTGKNPPFSKAVVIRNTNFKSDGQIDYSNIAILSVETKQLEKRKLQKHDIIIERSGGGPKQPVGRVVYFDKDIDGLDYSFSNFTSAIRVKNLSIFQPKYIFYFLHNFYLEGHTDQLQRRTTGIRNLDFQSYKDSVVFPFISLKEQIRIAYMLTTIEEAIISQEKLVETLKDLRKSMVQHLFTYGTKGEKTKKTEIGEIPESWNLVKANDLLEKVNFGTSEKCGNEPATYPVLRIPNIVNEYIDITDMKYCNLSEKRAKSFQLEKDDLIFVRTNGSRKNIGKNAIFEGQLDNCLFASFTIRARFNKALVDPRFIHYFTQSGAGSNYLFQAARSSAGKFNLNTQSIRNMPIPTTSLKEQQNICDVLGSIDKRKNIAQLKLQTYQNIFKTLLHELMSGERKINYHEN